MSNTTLVVISKKQNKAKQKTRHYVIFAFQNKFAIFESK